MRIDFIIVILRVALSIISRNTGGKMARDNDDMRIRKNVTDRLAEDTDLDSSDIEVSVENGAVTLRGSVDSLWDKRRAEDIVKSVPGIKGVNNKLRASMASQTTPIADFELRIAE
jgi:osmotically-inducible protein OsmY